MSSGGNLFTSFSTDTAAATEKARKKKIKEEQRLQLEKKQKKEQLKQKKLQEADQKAGKHVEQRQQEPSEPAELVYQATTQEETTGNSFVQADSDSTEPLTILEPVLSSSPPNPETKLHIDSSDEEYLPDDSLIDIRHEVARRSQQQQVSPISLARAACQPDFDKKYEVGPRDKTDESGEKPLPSRSSAVYTKRMSSAQRYRGRSAKFREDHRSTGSGNRYRSASPHKGNGPRLLRRR